MISVEELLSGAGLRVTRQRRLVLTLMADRVRPVTAQELHREIEESAIGLTTVYRTLTALADAGLLHVFDSGGELAYRMCRPGRHHHLVCRVCSSVTEGPTTGDLQSCLAAVGAEHGFVVEGHRIEVYGVCRDCQDRT
ncbi:Fur family transcriptional regulator [Actinomadura scrupuli]|uniref:Fur family transcriptional regulator n=1 Tax=Actinomadura scrupuli TaxID=559629 RepID=UPI003D98896A